MEFSLSLLNDTGLLTVLFPEVERMKGVEQSPDNHPEGDVFTHTMLVCKYLTVNFPEVDLSTRLAALLHDVAKPATQKKEAGRITFYGHAELGAEMTVNILKRMKFSNEVVEKTAELVKDHMKFMEVKKMKTSTLRRFLSSPFFEDKMKLHYADSLGSNNDLSNFDHIREKQKEFEKEGVRPQRLLTGNDLILLGMKPSKQFASLLEEVETQQLERRLTTKEEALEYVKRFLQYVSELRRR